MHKDYKTVAGCDDLRQQLNSQVHGFSVCYAAVVMSEAQQ